MMKLIYKIPIPKDNRSLLYHLIVAVLKKKSIVDQLEI